MNHIAASIADPQLTTDPKHVMEGLTIVSQEEKHFQALPNKDKFLFLYRKLAYVEERVSQLGRFVAMSNDRMGNQVGSIRGELSAILLSLSSNQEDDRTGL